MGTVYERQVMAGSWLSRATASLTQNLKEAAPDDRQLRRSLTGRFGSAVIRQVIEELSFDLIEAASEAARTVCASGVH